MMFRKGMAGMAVVIPILVSGVAAQAQQVTESPRQRLVDDYSSLENSLNIAAISKLRTAEDMRVLLDQSDRQAATLVWYQRWVAGEMARLKATPPLKK